MKNKSNVFHGGEISGDIDVSKSKRDMFGKGFYVTDTKDIASKYNKNITSYNLDYNDVIKGNKMMPESFAEKFDDSFDFPKEVYTYSDAYEYIRNKHGADKANKFFTDNGINSLSVSSPTGLSDTSTSIVIFNPKILKTKSQLTEIYNKAHGIVK